MSMYRELCGLGLSSPLQSRKRQRPVKLADAIFDAEEAPDLSSSTAAYSETTETGPASLGPFEEPEFVTASPTAAPNTPLSKQRKLLDEPDFPWLGSPLQPLGAPFQTKFATDSPGLLSLMASPPTSNVGRRAQFGSPFSTSPFFFGLDNAALTPDTPDPLSQAPLPRQGRTVKKRSRTSSVEEKVPAPVKGKAGKRQTGKKAPPKQSPACKQKSSKPRGRIALLTFGSAHGVHLRSEDGLRDVSSTLSTTGSSDSPSMKPSPLWSSSTFGS